MKVTVEEIKKCRVYQLGFAELRKYKKEILVSNEITKEYKWFNINDIEEATKCFNEFIKSNEER